MKKKIFDVLISIKARLSRLFKAAESDCQQPVATPPVEPLAPVANEETVNTHNEEFEAAQKSPLITRLISTKAAKVLQETRYFLIENQVNPRKIAYTVSGDLDAENILICLPGLLETKASFAVIHAYFLRFDNCKVISVDFSGRGDSDYIGSGDYKMSLYLSDISELIRGVALGKEKMRQRITILGTSMGGVLAMYLTQIFGKKIDGIILNDIALTVNWASLYALYKSMRNELGFRETRELAKELSVDQKAISDAQLPSHFDLSYQADIWGMNFHESLENFKGKVALIYGADSKICTKQRVQDARSYIPHMQTLEVPNAGHPAPFNLLVCDFIQSQMGV